MLHDHITNSKLRFGGRQFGCHRDCNSWRLLFDHPQRRVLIIVIAFRTYADTFCSWALGSVATVLHEDSVVGLQTFSPPLNEHCHLDAVFADLTSQVCPWDASKYSFAVWWVDITARTMASLPARAGEAITLPPKRDGTCALQYK